MECSENVYAPLGIEEAPAELAPMKQVVPDAPDVQEYEVVFVLRLAAGVTIFLTTDPSTRCCPASLHPCHEAENGRVTSTAAPR